LADEAGTRYAFQAGYNPSGLVPFLEASAKSSKPLAFEVFKTHPDPKARIKNIQQVLASLADWSRMPKLEARYSQQVLSRLR
jgi:predicted Zn-dependent protease